MVWSLLAVPATEAQDTRGQWQALDQELVRAYREGHYPKGVELAERALQLARQAFGPRDPDTLISINNLAFLYENQGRYGEAEPLYTQALALSREVLGEKHPHTITSINNLAFLYQRQGRYGEAEPLYAQAQALRREVLGEKHPDTIGTGLNGAGNLAALGKASEAARLLRQLQPRLLEWLGAELYASQDVARRASIVASQSVFQDLALSLAVAFPAEPAAQSLAALAMLRFKGLLAEEEAYLAHLGRESEDPRVKQPAGALKAKRQELAAAYHGGGSAERIEALLREANEAELALGRASRVYAKQLQVGRASLENLQGTLGSGNVLVELRRYQRADFGKWFQEERWGAVVVGFDSVRTVDLGEVGDTPALVAAVMHEASGADAAARILHERLIAPLQLPSSVQRVYLAPDDVLHLLPFPRLLDARGKRLTESSDIRLVQTSRDLLRPDETQPAKGLLALGGIDFGKAVRTVELKTSVFTRGSQNDLRAATAESFRQGFAALEHSGPEVEALARLYRQARPAEPTEVWTKSEASEAGLKQLKRPPRVLHLATHGFYRPARDPTDRPMLLAGISLAGANLALGKDSEDGILYAVEAQDLNLSGTELVVLSACETAQGVIQSGDGVYGLVRALRTAGARHVLVTLRPIGDASASSFMEGFYRNLLFQPPGRSDPAAALRDTQLDLLKNQPTFDWSPYVLIGG